MENLIDIKNVSVKYNTGTLALNDISLEVDRGEFLFVVGASGSGKTTLIKSILREIDITNGKIYVDHEDIGQIKRKKMPFYRRKIGVVFQEFRLLKDRNIYENVALAQRVIGVDNKKMEANVMDMLDKVGLAHKRKSYPRELSGGEQQRVAIARAMVNRPYMLLADEPTGNLDPNNSYEIMNLLEKLNDRGTTVMVVSHNNEIVDKMKKRVITLDGGSIVSDVRSGGYEE